MPSEPLSCEFSKWKKHLILKYLIVLPIMVCLLFLSVWRSTQVSGEKIPLQQTDNLLHKLVNKPVVSLSSDADSQKIATSEKAVNHQVDASFLPGIQKQDLRTTRIKRTPTGFSARGMHEDIFDRDFGHFSPVKRRPEADAAGFYGDTFSGGFGEFETMKRTLPLFLADKRISTLTKRRPEMGAQGFHGDTFAQGFGEFDTMKRNDPYSNWMENAVKRRPEMTKSGFHGDVFNGGFGEFHPMRK
ncbi:unnamed protein product [Allacma fusca]|uniref:Uncharacterized protein n=1 Tax=Allacma fusca TaxID=39272 RepID=A0A8J2LP07_9HEXA|nr:unnamed protein product [Allacma fusca]